MVCVHLKKGLEYIKELILAILIAIIFMCFILSHNEIPSGSMISTLNKGDHVLTIMLPFYYREPQYGEIVVFKRPSGENWVKRVIGLPGDEIDIIDGMVYRNGQKLDETAYLAEGISSKPAELVELEDKIMHPVSFPYTVPEGCYFLMGDNRPESGDCRYLGAIKSEAIYGKALVRIYPFDAVGLLK